MNSLDRVSAAIHMQPVDRTPVIPLIAGWTAGFTGRKLNDYLLGGDCMAACLLEAQERLGHDAMLIFADIALEAEAAGTKLEYVEGQHPNLAEYAVNATEDVARLRLPDPQESGRMPGALEACSIMRQSVRDEVGVVGLVTGPMSIAANLTFIGDLLYMIADDPAAFRALLDFALEVSAVYAASLITAGAHCISIADPAGTPTALPKDIFREEYIPRAHRLVERVKESGSPAVGFFLWGLGPDTLPDCASTGADVLHLDHQIPLKNAFSIVPDKCVAGNIKAYAFANDSPALMKSACREAIELSQGRNGYILASGGEVPLDAKAENIAAMIETARS
ncbi:MAG: uroporphyrinogen decarboxylase family protein [Armatimonadota bacterium]|nr:uroporphyrinogen decarboxylase family protein [Armatimonadota bacterium]